MRSLTGREIKRLMFEEFKYVEENLYKDYDIIAVEGAILIEAKTSPYFDEMWVTTLRKDLALKRVLQRNPELSESRAKDRINR